MSRRAPRTPCGVRQAPPMCRMRSMPSLPQRAVLRTLGTTHGARSDDMVREDLTHRHPRQSRCRTI